MLDLKQYETDRIFSPIQKDIVSTLEHNGPMTRAEIVKALNKPRTTLYDNLAGLMAYNIVEKFVRPTNFRGRPLVFFKVIDNV